MAWHDKASLPNDNRPFVRFQMARLGLNGTRLHRLDESLLPDWITGGSSVPVEARLDWIGLFGTLIMGKTKRWLTHYINRRSCSRLDRNNSCDREGAGVGKANVAQVMARLGASGGFNSGGRECKIRCESSLRLLDMHAKPKRNAK